MSRDKYKARGKVTLKNSRDGLVEHNAATGEDTRISKREAEFDLRGETPGGEHLSKFGKTPASDTQRKQAPRRGQTRSGPETQSSDTRRAESPTPQRYDETPTVQTNFQQSVENSPDNAAADNAAAAPEPSPAKPGSGKPGTKPGTDGGGRLKFTPSDATPAPKAKYKQKPPVAKVGKPVPGKMDTAEPPAPAKTAGRDIVLEQDAPATDSRPGLPQSKSASKKAVAAHKQGKTGRLQFAQEETAPGTPKITHNRKLGKAEAKAERVTDKLERARDNLPAKRKLRKVSVTDEQSGAVKRKLQFEKTPISQGEHIKGALPLRPAKAAGNSLIFNTHRKLYQVEHENVGVKAAHRAEMLGETGARTALRFHKTAPYRKVAKLERAVQKKSVNLTYQQALAQNPKLKSNILSRAMQKRKIKKDYAKAAREAQKAAKKAKKAGSAVADAGKAVLGVVKRHPIASVVVILIGLFIFMLTSLFGSFGGIGGSGISGIVASTYLAEDTEIYAAETAYAGLEADLQHELDNYATLHPGYDEYRFNLDGIWHDPYVLISILSAMHEGEWTLDGVQGTLAMLFDRQYTLTEAVTRETRYRTETTTETDPVTGDSYEVSTDVEYDYYICTVTLENFNLSHLPIYIMGEDGLSRYALFMATLGNRPDLFPVYLYPNASFYQDYGRHDIPPEYFDDAIFAGMIREAEKYLGMPYVWGGYSPATSFDCSGFVSWVLNNSGWDIGRLTAQGLYNISTPVSASNAKPGDLIFFHSTYQTADTVTHVGIYVGDGMMLHCGHPIGYASVNTAYWQQHLYAYGRMY